MRKDASWRRMLPIQPPPTVLEIAKMHPSGLLRKLGQPIGEVARIISEKGITMGILYDLGWETASRPFAKWACLWNMFPFDKDSMAPRPEVGDDVISPSPFLPLLSTSPFTSPIPNINQN